MGTYKYCPHCAAGMDRPTIQEAGAGERACHQCGALTPVEPDELGWLLEELNDKIEEMEKQMTKHIIPASDDTWLIQIVFVDGKPLDKHLNPVVGWAADDVSGQMMPVTLMQPFADNDIELIHGSNARRVDICRFASKFVTVLPAEEIPPASFPNLEDALVYLGALSVFADSLKPEDDTPDAEKFPDEPAATTEEVEELVYETDPEFDGPVFKTNSFWQHTSGLVVAVDAGEHTPKKTPGWEKITGADYRRILKEQKAANGEEPDEPSADVNHQGRDYASELL